MSEDKRYKDEVTISIPSQNIVLKLPLINGSEGPDAIDIRELYSKAGIFTYDPGFMSTASCTSSITFIDGEKGILKHRGYAIEQLAEHKSFLEVAYLLYYGNLADEKEYVDFCAKIAEESIIKPQSYEVFKGFSLEAHPMSLISALLATLSAYYHKNLNVKDAKQRESHFIKLVAKIPTIAAMAYKHYTKGNFIVPDRNKGYADNFLHMLFSQSADNQYDANSVKIDALNKLLILHADHEQNASTSTVRLAGSSYANPYAVINAGVSSLWGSAHGGANEAVLNMLQNIGTTANIPSFIERAKDKSDPFRLMGFGHRVYKNYDPRAKVLKQACHDLLQTSTVNDDMLAIALKLEEIALHDEYFIERRLYPNVDFYSGLIYRMLGIPNEMFTVMFAVARTAGWVSQWNEMMSDPEQKIGRPRQIYIGYGDRQLIK